jgi:actin-like ATPase involved in cell morphogenesis
MPGLDELIRHETGLTVTIDDEPLTTVARGAGKALEEASVRPRRARHRTRRPR